jgi:hypothetical protein
MPEVICGERVSLPLGLTWTVMPGVQALRLTASALPSAPAGPRPAAAAAAMNRLRGAAAGTLREHVSDGETGVGRRLAWRCGPAHRAAPAFGAGRS